jgi:hypothetical protein
MTPSELRALLGCRLVPNVPGMTHETARYLILSFGASDVKVKHVQSGRASTMQLSELQAALAARLLRIEPK